MTEQNAIVSLKEYARSPEIVERFAEVVGKQNAGGYISSVLLAVAVNESLQRCEPKSIISAALRAATLRLSCDPGVGQAYPVPFKGKAVLVIGYKGLINMATRTGKYRFINAGPVYEGEEFVEDRITGLGKIEGHAKSRNVIGYVAAFQLVAGYSKTIYMSVEEIHELAKKYSKSYNMTDSAWKTNKQEMESKTVLRRLITRWGYLDPSDAMMVTENVDGDVVDGEEIDDLPAPGEVTVIPPEPITGTLEEITSRLYGDDPNAAQPAPNGHKPAEAVAGLMPLEMALEVKDSKGVYYHGQDTETLNNVLNTIQGVIDGRLKNQKGYTPEELDYRKKAIISILANRANN